MIEKAAGYNWILALCVLVSFSEGAIKSAIQFIYLTIGRPDFYGFVDTFSSMYHLFAVKTRD